MHPLTYPRRSQLARLICCAIVNLRASNCVLIVNVTASDSASSTRKEAQHWLSLFMSNSEPQSIKGLVGS